MNVSSHMRHDHLRKYSLRHEANDFMKSSILNLTAIGISVYYVCRVLQITVLKDSPFKSIMAIELSITRPAASEHAGKRMQSRRSHSEMKYLVAHNEQDVSKFASRRGLLCHTDIHRNTEIRAMMRLGIKYFESSRFWCASPL